MRAQSPSRSISPPLPRQYAPSTSPETESVHDCVGSAHSLRGWQVGKMTAVNHPCIVRCYGMLEPSPGIVLELVEGGSPFQIIHAKPGETFAGYRSAPRHPSDHSM